LYFCFNRAGKGAMVHLPAVLRTPLEQQLVAAQLSAILGSGGGNSQQVAAAWSSYLELVIEPTGWLAVWIPSSEVKPVPEFS
jgi:hypothetical protein